jgi:hypothetical protein
VSKVSAKHWGPFEVLLAVLLSSKTSTAAYQSELLESLRICCYSIMSSIIKMSTAFEVFKVLLDKIEQRR